MSNEQRIQQLELEVAQQADVLRAVLNQYLRIHTMLKQLDTAALIDSINRTMDHATGAIIKEIDRMIAEMRKHRSDDDADWWKDES